MKIRLKLTQSLLVFVFAILAATGCANVKKTAAINLLVPSDGYTKQQFSYGNDRQQSFDLYLPKTRTPKIPIVYVYGSAWRKKFNKADFVFVAQALTSLGHPVNDLPMDDAEVFPIFNTTTAQRAKPVMNVRRGMPPTLLLHGLADPRVPSYHTTRFRDALLRSGNPVTTKLYPGVDHEKLLGGIAVPLRFMSNSFVDVREFLGRYYERF